MPTNEINKWESGQDSFGYGAWTGHSALGVNLNRQQNAPLDISCEFKSIKDMLYYVTEGRYPVNGTGVSTEVLGMKKYPYLGQVIALVNVDPEEVSIYFVKTAAAPAFTETTDDAVFEHYFEEVGRATVGDNKSIYLDAENGILSIKNYGVEYYHWVPTTGDVAGHYEKVTVDATHPWIEGLEPRVKNEGTAGTPNLVIAWYEPNSETITGLTSRVVTLEGKMDVVQGTASTSGSIAEAKKAGDDAMTAVTTLESGKVATLETKVGKSSTETGGPTGLIKDVIDLQTADEQLDGRLDVLEGLHAKDGDTFKTVAQEVTTGINALDSTATIASVSSGVVTLKNQVIEADGKISVSTSTENDITLAKVATTGAAADVSITDSSSKITATNVDAALTELVDKIGAANGVASLDANAKVPLGQLPDVILGQLTFGGSFDGDGIATISAGLKTKLGITDNTIQLVNGATDDTTITPKEYGYKTLEGVYFLADATFTIAGMTFEVGDWLISIGTAWKKIDNTDAVTGVKGDAELVYRTGNVNISKADIGLGSVANTGDSATPVEGGTTKFTTGGAYTELAKKVDKTTTIAGVDLQDNITAAELRTGLNVSDGANKVEATAKSGKISIDGTEVQIVADNTVTDADYKHITVTANSVSDGTTTFTKYDDTALAGRVTTAEGKITALEDKTAGDYTVGTGSTATTDIKHYIDDKDSKKADKVASATNGNFAGLDSSGNLTDSGSKAADFATAAQGTKADSALQGVQVNGTDLTVDTNKKVNVTVAEGTNNGAIKVNGADVSVHGLGTAAYQNVGAFDAAGSAANVLGTSSDTATDITVYGARALANSLKGDSSTAQASDTTIEGAKKYTDAAKSALQGNTTATIRDVKDIADAADTLSKANQTAIATLNGDATTAGSVAKAVADAKAELKGTAATAQASDTTIEGAKKYADSVSATAIAGLDTTVTGMGAGKTLATLTETDGIVAATFQDIAITASQITDGSSTFEAKFTDGSATIATESSGVVTIKAGVGQSAGAVTQGTGSDITLAKVATTGSAVDITATGFTATTVQGALEELDTAIGAETTRATGAEGALEERIENLESRGRFLSSWNALTGKPTTDPTTLPYQLKAGDYFIVGTVLVPSDYEEYDSSKSYVVDDKVKVTGASSVTYYVCKEATTGTFDPSKWTEQTNKQPEAKTVSGKSGLYYTGEASVTAETRTLGVGDYYTFDGTRYVLVSNSQKTINISQVAGLQTELDSKTPQTRTIAGQALTSDISKASLLTALNVADGAQVNVLEGVKIGDTALEITNKSVTLPAATASALGLVKVDNDTIAVSDGEISIKGVYLAGTYVQKDDAIVLNGGQA